MITVLLILLIIVLFVITVFSLGAAFVLKRREQDADASEKLAAVTAKMEAQLDGCLHEINELGAVVARDIDEKHRAVLFLYELMQNKEREMPVIKQMAEVPVPLPEPEEIPEPIEEPAEMIADTPEPEDELPDFWAAFEKEDAVDVEIDPVFDNPKHAEIWAMAKEGKTVTSIARKLKMGKGEVQLVLDLAGYREKPAL